MSATLAISSGITINSGTKFSWPTTVSTVTQTGKHVYTNTQDVPTTAGGTALAVGAGIATLGWAIFYNLDATNYIQIGVVVSGTFYPLVRCLPADAPAQLPLDPGVTLYALAHTATVSLLYAILER